MSSHLASHSSTPIPSPKPIAVPLSVGADASSKRTSSDQRTSSLLHKRHEDMRQQLTTFSKRFDGRLPRILLRGVRRREMRGGKGGAQVGECPVRAELVEAEHIADIHRANLALQLAVMLRVDARKQRHWIRPACARKNPGC